MELLTKRYAEKITGILSCYDRIVVKGTLPTVCYPKGMTRYLFEKDSRVFDYAKFAEPLGEKIKTTAEQLAAGNELTIEFIKSHKGRKEDIVKKHFDGEKQGLIYILSAMEACQTYKPWHDKVSHKNYLKSDQGKCLHYYSYNIRLEGSRIKHSMGPVSIKMYEKFNKILRIETTVNDVSFFKHYRTVEHYDGTTSHKQASVKKNIFSLPVLCAIMKAANSRYVEFISSIEDNSVGKQKLQKITSSKVENERTYKGFSFFEKTDQSILVHLRSGEFNISGFRSKDLKKRFKNLSSFQISRTLKRLRVMGLIKKIGTTYKYYLTKIGKEAILTALKIKTLVIIPQLII